uniref:Outer membrane protein TolC n=1 Tax=Candidatus Kentrum sp. FW TaxID=2126338 RepID=A0A450T3Q5_9GAMM|nr:MAG: Outer membrane protein TolC [Candidatus Kentron sp. FW]VFJ61224.1 MAG: Outer membrane protein TolC [Candidatus Kentron sp. FW]
MADSTTTCGYLRRLIRSIISILFVISLTACAVIPEPLTRDELEQQGQKDRKRLFKDIPQLREGEVLTLPRAIARALKYNLEHRVKMMEEALALEQSDLDKFDLLPSLAANAGYHSRSELKASRQKSLANQASKPDYSYSSEKDRGTNDLTISWNILDFGIGYYTARQNSDRSLIAAERRRKVIHNLIRDVRLAYWRTAASQALEDPIRETLDQAQKELANADTQVQENQGDPVEALHYQKILLENIWELESVQQELSTAHIDLAALIRARPGADIRVAVPEEGNLVPPQWDIPLPEMEEMAFLNNPDIREKAYNSRIAVRETYKAILGTLPGIGISHSYRYDSDDFLKANDWYDWSAKLTWNLFNILSAPERIEYAETAERIAEEQRLALRMAVLTQVHIANHQFQDTLRQFQLADRFSELSRKIAGVVKDRMRGPQSIRDFVYEKTSEITSQLRRYQSYAKLEAAYGQLRATLGLDIMPEAMESDDLQEVTVAVGEALAAARKNGGVVKHALVEEGTTSADGPPTESAYFKSAIGMHAEIVKISLELTRLPENRNGGDSINWNRWNGYGISTALSN